MGSKLKNFTKKSKDLLTGNRGASNVEIIVWISVVLVIAIVLYAFRDNIEDFLGKASGTVNSMSAGKYVP